MLYGLAANTTICKVNNQGELLATSCRMVQLSHHVSLCIISQSSPSKVVTCKREYKIQLVM